MLDYIQEDLPIMQGALNGTRNRWKPLNLHALCMRKRTLQHNNEYRTRQPCSGCVINQMKGGTQQNKAKKVSTFCKDCIEKPFYCTLCFLKKHELM